MQIVNLPASSSFGIGWIRGEGEKETKERYFGFLTQMGWQRWGEREGEKPNDSNLFIKG